MSQSVVDKSLEAIRRVEALGDEATKIFIKFDPEYILRQAQEVERRKKQSRDTMPLAGWLISLKDMIDEEGFVTTAGSRLMALGPPATADSAVALRLRHAGAILFGRTSMSEFAYSGVGLNPHFGTPGNALHSDHIPGGSSSGAALSVALGLCDAAIGTDTGGSVRIPAAANGLYGLKPSQNTVPLSRVHPLSPTFDCVGPLASNFESILAVQSVLTGKNMRVQARDTADILIGLPVGALLDGLDSATTKAWENTLLNMQNIEVKFKEVDLGFLAKALPLARIIVSSEALIRYAPFLDDLEKVGDPTVLRRIRYAQTLTPSDVSDAYKMRDDVVQQYRAALAGVDVLVSPTLPTLPPTIAAVKADFDRLNARMLRNPSMINIADGCAVTLPVPGPDKFFPGAIMLSAPNGKDELLLSTAKALLPHLQGR